jgi:hypothetical protein
VADPLGVLLWRAQLRAQLLAALQVSEWRTRKRPIIRLGGTLAGKLLAILMALLTITYHMHPLITPLTQREQSPNGCRPA